MPGLEIIVRPVVLPDTRPVPQPVRQPPASGEEGLSSIVGSGGGLIDLAQSQGGGWSKQRKQEVKRQYDEVKVKNEEDEEQYVRQEVVKKLWIRNEKGEEEKWWFEHKDYENKETVEVEKRDLIRENRNPDFVGPDVAESGSAEPSPPLAIRRRRIR